MKYTVQNEVVFVADGGCRFTPEKPSIVYLHGAGMDHTVWGHQTRYTAHHGFNCLAPDLPGHFGSSGRVPDRIETYAQWVHSFIEESVKAPVILVGHSMGALIALEAASQRPDLYRGLLLVGVAAKMGVHPALLAAADGNEPLAPALIAAWGHGPSAHRGGNPASGIWMIGSALRLLERAAPGLLANDLRACAAYEGALSAARQLTIPVQIISGRFDKMTPPRAAQPLIDAMSTGEAHVLPASGHMMMVEAQQECREIFMQFFNQVTAPMKM